MSFLASLFEGFIWLVGLFHKGADDKLAELKVKSKTDDAIIKGLQNENTIDESTDNLSAADVDRRLRESYTRK